VDKSMCILSGDKLARCAGTACETCGWYGPEAERRKVLIRAGKTKISAGGTRRLIVKGTL